MARPAQAGDEQIVESFCLGPTSNTKQSERAGPAVLPMTGPQANTDGECCEHGRENSLKAQRRACLPE